jgi:hypothetical protein
MRIVAITARPRLPGGGQVPRAVPEIELFRPSQPEPRPTLKRREEINAAAEFDRICAARPLKPPPLPQHNETRSAGARALAKEIRLGDYTP